MMHRSGKAVLFKPSGGIAVDIRPCFPIIQIIADDVLIISALPQFPLQACYATLICSGRFQRADDTAQCRGDPCGRPIIAPSADKMNMVRHDDIVVKRNGIEGSRLIHALHDDPPVFGQARLRATTRVAPTD